MSELGQKIYKWIVWILLLLVVVAIFAHKVYVAAHPKITEKEWLEILGDNIGNSGGEQLSSGMDYATGEYIVLSGMKAIGESYVSFATGKEIENDEDLIRTAIELGVISEKELSKELTKEEAEDILSKTNDALYNLEEYPSFFSVDYVCDVMETKDWDIRSFDVEENSAIVSGVNTELEKGQVVILQDEFGIGRPRKIVSIAESDDSSYRLELEQLSKPDDLINELDFSGKADFSYLARMSGEPVSYFGDSNSEPVEEGRLSNSFFSFEPLEVYAAEPKEFSTTADIEVGGKVSAKLKDGKDSYPINAYLKVKDEEGSSKYSITRSKKGKLKLEIEKGDVTLEAERDANKAESSSDEMKKEGSVTDSILFKAKISDLTIAATHLRKGPKKDRFVDVRVNANVELDTVVTGKFEGKIPITEFEVPIVGTWGLVTVNIRLYLIASATGEVTLAYEMYDVKLGLNISSDGFVYNHSRDESRDRFDYLGKVKLEGGFSGEVAICVGDWLDLVEYDLVDPGIDVKFEASAEKLAKKEGFEDYPNCVQLSFAAPTVSLEVSAGEDSLFYTIANFFKLDIKSSYDLITADNAPFKKEYHIETSKNGESVSIEGGEEICTHVKTIETQELEIDPIELAKQRAQEAAQRKLEEERRKAQEALEAAIEAAIERWLEENCGECY